jgi:pilus biogenesis lipoprotein CpaD
MRKALYLPAMLFPLALAACGSSAGQQNSTVPSTEPLANYPIKVVPAIQTVALSTNDTGDVDADPARLRAVVVDYSRRGHGGIIIEGSAASVRKTAEALLEVGADVNNIVPKVDRDDGGAEISFQVFQASTPACGKFTSDNPRFGLESPNNENSSELGCVTQANFAAMLADPLDVVRREGPAVGVNSSLGVGAIEDQKAYQAPEKPVASAGGSD